MSDSQASVEKCYTPKEVAVLLGISQQTVRVRFRKLRGVLRLGDGERRRIRIPETVFREWVRRHQVEGG